MIYTRQSMWETNSSTMNQIIIYNDKSIDDNQKSIELHLLDLNINKKWPERIINNFTFKCNFIYTLIMWYRLSRTSFESMSTNQYDLVRKLQVKYNNISKHGWSIYYWRFIDVLRRHGCEVINTENDKINNMEICLKYDVDELWDKQFLSLYNSLPNILGMEGWTPNTAEFLKEENMEKFLFNPRSGICMNIQYGNENESSEYKLLRI